MESALTPRDIQARIRGGESLESVAAIAGVPVASIADYATPILRELDYLVHLARKSQVRRRGEASAQRLLGDVVDTMMTKQEIDPETVNWTARRDENRRWTVRVTWQQDDQPQEANFNYDQRGRFATAADEGARGLIGDTPKPSTVTVVNQDEEPTVDLNDELAIVRAVQDEVPVTVLPDVPSSRIVKLPETFEPADYAEAELAEVDGIYDIVPNPDSDMDVLYDMLAGFNEDSVRIYSGLTQPVAPQLPAEPAVEEMTVEVTRTVHIEATTEPGKNLSPSIQQEPDDASGPASEETLEPAPSAPELAKAGQDPKVSDLVEETTTDQDALATAEPKVASKSRKSSSKKRKRASVPSWDEIMFGGPSRS